MSSIALTPANKPVNPFAAIVRKPLHLAQLPGLNDSDALDAPLPTPKATEAAPALESPAPAPPVLRKPLPKVPAASSEQDTVTPVPQNAFEGADAFATWDSQTDAPYYGASFAPNPSAAEAAVPDTQPRAAEYPNASAAAPYNNSRAPWEAPAYHAPAAGAAVGSAGGIRGFFTSPRTWSRKKQIIVGASCVAVLVIIIGATAGTAAKKSSNDDPNDCRNNHCNFGCPDYDQPTCDPRER